MQTVAEKIIEYLGQLNFDGKLPDGIGIMNPFRENEEVMEIARQFYGKYYNDTQPRHMILGINPGRFGGGVTGIPFTDGKRIVSECGIPFSGKPTHEPSSVFVHEVIHAYGGLAAFYQKFYINSVCPLGFTTTGKAGKTVNYNYYDTPALTAAAYPFIVSNIWAQLALGMKADVCFCLGTGKNEAFLKKLNEQHHFFGEVVALPHPRWVMQYRANNRAEYVALYLEALSRIG